METRSYKLSSNQTTAPVRQSTQMEKARRQAVGISAVLMVIMLGLAVTFTTLAINAGRGGGNLNIDDGPGDQVSTAVVMGVPISGAYEILQGYDENELQWNETAGGWTGNKSVKIVVGRGTPVLATYAGTITNIVNDSLEGTIVEITHRDGLMTRYLGLSSNVNVKKGDTVEKGWQIGSVGTRPVDNKDGPHVKLEVLKDGKKINPADFIPNLFPGDK